MGKKPPKDHIPRKRIDLTSSDVNAERVDALKHLFPEAFIEAKVDFDKLKAAMGESINDAPERYTFSWAGKSEAIRILQTPTRATLKPCKEESVDWDNTKNLFLEGDNLEVLKLLYKSYFGRVKMIYIDPPYNTGNDFVYPDNYADPLATYLKLTGQQDAEGNLLTSNPETSGRYHSAWLSMMYPRLFLARQLLREDGVIFVSIDDTEVHNLRMMMNEIFGEENFFGQFIWHRRQRADSRNQTNVSPDHEYIVAFSKMNNAALKGEKIDTDKYTNPDNDPRGPWASIDLSGLATANQRPNLHYDIIDPNTGDVYPPNPNRGWSKSKANVERMIKEGRIIFPKKPTGRPREKKFLNELNSTTTGFSTYLESKRVGYTTNGTRELTSLFNNRVFSFPKPSTLLREFISQMTSGDDIVLDFFSGSSTLAHAVINENNDTGSRIRFIMAQLPEPCEQDSEAFQAGFLTIADIGKERIRRAIKQIKEQHEVDTNKANGGLFKDKAGKEVNLDLGFRVYKLSESTHRPWLHTHQASPEQFAAYQAQLEEQLDPILEGSTPEDILWEVALKEGYSLTSRVENLCNHSDSKSAPKPSNPFTLLFRVTDEDKGQSFLICLDDEITLSSIKTLELMKNELFVCRDRAITDEVAANLALQCRLKTL